MKLNNFTTLHTDADIDGKDVCWDFITEALDAEFGGIITHTNPTKAALFLENGTLMQLRHTLHNISILSHCGTEADRERLAHAIADPINADKDTDLYCEIERYDRSISRVHFKHSNTSDLKCRYKVEHDGKTYEGEFFLDMLDDAHYEGAWDDNPDRHTFYHTFSTDNGECNHGIEIIVTLNADGKFEYSDTILESIDTYLWHRCEDGHMENYDTIDADIEIINIETNEIINQ